MQLEKPDKFCVGCGQPIPMGESTSSHTLILDQKWWSRLSKVIYIILYIPLPFILFGVWTANSSDYDYFLNSYSKTTGKAFWYSLLTLAIYVIIARLIRITFFYITFAQKPNWRGEFKRFFSLR